MNVRKEKSEIGTELQLVLPGGGGWKLAGND